MKPTYGRVSRYGIVAFASSLDQIGPFARDTRDAAALLHAVAGRDERDSTSSPVAVPDALLRLAASDDEAAASLRGRRLGLPREYFVAGMEPAVERAVREAVDALEAAGAIVDEVSLPHTDYGLATYYIVAPAEASANLARYDGIRFGPRRGEGRDVLADYLATRGGGFGPEVKRRVMLGTYALSAGYYDAYYLKAQKVRTLIKGDFDALWAQGFDAIVAPTSPTVAFPFGARLADPVAMYLSDACTLPVNMAGLPGVSIPAGLADGLPVGLQVIGAAWSEPTLFEIGRAYEAITADAAWRALEPTGLPALDDPATPTPAERMAAVGAAGR
jgi:aspartyl-tRNA(Asn)/glutamyl-tRNA(Gln) amidotransferase subunit A